MLRFSPRTWLAALAVVLALPATACASTGQATQPSASNPCHTGITRVSVTHIIVIMEENKNYSKVIGNTAAAPYQNQLANECGLGTNMHNVSHPSLPNYIGITSGQEQGRAVNSDCNVSSCAQPQGNIFSELEAAGLSWKAYAESATSNCQTSDTPLYAQRHVPAVYYTDIHGTSCLRDAVPMTSNAAGGPTVQAGDFKTALDTNTLPALSFVTPNMCDDGHTSSISGYSYCKASGKGTTYDEIHHADSWLKAWVPYILNSSSYASGDTEVWIAYDEGFGGDYGAGEHCWDSTHSNSTGYPSCHIMAEFLSPYTPALKSSTDFNLYNVLNTAASILGVPTFPGNSITGTPTANNLQATFGL